MYNIEEDYMDFEKKKRKGNKILLALVIILILALGAGIFFFFIEKDAREEEINNYRVDLLEWQERVNVLESELEEVNGGNDLTDASVAPTKEELLAILTTQGLDIAYGTPQFTTIGEIENSPFTPIQTITAEADYVVERISYHFFRTSPNSEWQFFAGTTQRDCIGFFYAQRAFAATTCDYWMDGSSETRTTTVQNFFEMRANGANVR